RLSSTNIKGFQWYTTMGHNRARFFAADGGVFRIDHDQNFQQTTNVRYQWKRNGPWGAFTWRYDSGLVAGRGAAPEEAAPPPTPAGQATFCFFVGGQEGHPEQRTRAVHTGHFGKNRLKNPGGGHRR